MTLFVLTIVLSSSLFGKRLSDNRQPICGGVNLGFDAQNRPIMITKDNLNLLQSKRPVGISKITGEAQIIVKTDSTTESFDAYIDTLVSEILPLIEEVYGPPFTSVTVTVTYDSTQFPWFYYNAYDQEITVSCRPGEVTGGSYGVNPYRHDDDDDGYIDEDPFDGIDNDNDGLVDEDPDNDPKWDGVFTHELIHAFHTGIHLYITWVEEGMTECTAQLVAKIMEDEKTRKLSRAKPENTIPFYDTWNNLGKEQISCLISPIYKVLPDMWYNSVSALHWILMISQSDEVVVGDWKSLDYFKKLNESFCTTKAIERGVLWQDEIIFRMSSLSLKPIDGIPFAEWIEQQNICYGSDFYAIGEGRYLCIYTFGNTFDNQLYWGTTNPEMFNVFGYTRSENNPLEKVIICNDPVVIRIYDVSGNEVWNNNGIEVTLSDINGYNEYEIGETKSWEKGAYRIVADLVLDGIDTLHAENFFLVTGQMTSIDNIFNSAKQGIGLISIDEDRQLYNAPFLSDDGQFEMNENGGAILNINDLLLSDVSIDVQRDSLYQTFSIPNPFTRVVTFQPLVKQKGTLLSGWPQAVFDNVFLPVEWLGIGDVNNDGLQEIVAWLDDYYNGGIWIFRPDGNDLPGWPIHQMSSHWGNTPLGRPYGLYDLDSDGAKEIIFEAYFRQDYMKVYRGNGEQYPWNVDIHANPKENNFCFLDIVPDSLGKEILLGAYALYQDGSRVPGFPLEFLDLENLGMKRVEGGDLNGNGDTEIVVIRGWYEQPGSRSQTLYLYVLNQDGTVKPGWPQQIGFLNDEHLNDFPVFPIGDIDWDGTAEIVCAVAENIKDSWTDPSPKGQIAIYRLDGTMMPGWPYRFEKADYMQTILADLNRDSLLEIIAYVEVTDNKRRYFKRSLYVFDCYGNILPGWPKDDLGWCNGIVCGNIDGDIEPEIILTGPGIYMWNADGSIVPGSPYKRFNIAYNEPKYFENPVLCDLNEDGFTNLVTISDNAIYVWDMGAPYDESLMDWPMLEHDNNYTCFYGPVNPNPLNVGKDKQLLGKFKLSQNYPNPFNPSTTIEYYIPQTSDVVLSIYNIKGQKINELVNQQQQSGYYKVKFNAMNYSSGVYFYQIKAGDFKQVKKCLLIK